MYTRIQWLRLVYSLVHREFDLDTAAADLKNIEADLFHARKKSTPVFSMPRGPSYGPSPIYKLHVTSEKEDEPRSSVLTTLLSQFGFVARHVFNLGLDGRHYGTTRSGCPHSFSSDNPKKHVALLVLLFLPVASALDNEVAPSRSHGSASRAFAWISLYSLVRILIGWVIALIIMIGGHLGGVAKTVTGPLMGFTSVLWMTMRNDSAVRPEYSWM